jgi:D-alanyl-lipoteichoic acid acyltransferase DltB (MBOAT superfamily)
MLQVISEPFTFLNVAFWAFLGIVFVGLAATEKRMRMRNAFLFFASLYFYWKTSGVFVGLLVFTTVSDWWLGGRIAAAEGTRRKLWLATSLTTNLAVLLYFKYAYFLADALQPLLGTHWSQPHAALGQWANDHLGTSFRVDQILLPVGISFYTFQTMSYAIDVYRKEVEPVRSVLDFGFFVSFFPQLVAGPIVRAKTFIPQLYQPYALSRTEFGMGLFWIMNGLIKKVWLADYLAVNLVDRVFANPSSYSGFENLIALYAYSLQVYADFSGYTDMAIGIALLMGFHLPTNFRSPYKAKNVGEFWKRWHISLSSWLKDYLYIPMGGNRGASLFTMISGAFLLSFILLLLPNAGARLIALGCCCLLLATVYAFPTWRVRVSTNINLMMTMLLGGLWHGASWNFVLWGGLNGLGLVVYKAWRRVSPWEGYHRWWQKALGVFLTFHFITWTRIWFRSGSHVSWESMETPHDVWTEWFTANAIIEQLVFAFWSSPFADILSAYAPVLALLAAGMIIHWMPERLKQRYRLAFAQAPMAVQVIAAVATIALAYAGMASGVQPFIYFQF